MKIETFSSDKKIIHSGTTILFNNDSYLIFKISTESYYFNFDLKLVFKDDKECIKRAFSSGNGYVHADRMWQQACRK